MKAMRERLEGISRIRLEGRLDATSVNDAEGVFNAAFEDAPGAAVAVDLSSLEYISSAGLRLLLSIAKRLQSQTRRLALFGLSGNVHDVFEISGFSSIFEICKDEPSALESLRKPSV